MHGMEAEDGRPEKEDGAPPKDDICIGSLVHLKSGGPMMSVEEISEPASKDRVEVHCVWFGDNGQRDREIFDARTLKLDR